MNPRFTISLSYNPVDVSALAEMLHKYDGQDHHQIITDFESELSAFTGSKYVVGLNSGTAAIHLALRALGVGENDYVIAPTFTYVASVTPILYLKAIPVFVDSELLSWNMDARLMEDAIKACLAQGKKPKAIIVVHTYGMPAAMDAILEISSRYDVPVIEDAAEAIGSSYRGQALGTLTKIGVLSFNNNKVLTTYGGGALLTGQKAWADKTAFWAAHARQNLPYYEHEEMGYNYRLGLLNAAAGLTGLATIKKNVGHRRGIFDIYRDLLKSVKDLRWQEESDGSLSNRWLSCIVLEGKRDVIQQALFAYNIETRPLWKPMHLQPLYKNSLNFLNGTSEKLFENGVCLPSGNDLTPENIREIVMHIKTAIT